MIASHRPWPGHLSSARDGRIWYFLERVRLANAAITNPWPSGSLTISVDTAAETPACIAHVQASGQGSQHSAADSNYSCGRLDTIGGTTYYVMTRTIPGLSSFTPTARADGSDDVVPDEEEEEEVEDPMPGACASTQVRYYDIGGRLYRTRCTDGVSTTMQACLGTGDAMTLETWDPDAPAVCLGSATVEFPDTITGDDDSVTPEDIDDLLDDLEDLADTMPTGEDLDSDDYFKNLMESQVRQLVTNALANGCLGGLGTFTNFLGAAPPWWDFLLPGQRAHAFFGGGFSVAALLPVLKSQLAQMIIQVSEAVKQRCHQKAIEANSQSTAVSNAAILNEIMNDGTVTRATAVVMASPVLEQIEAQHSGRAYSGTITEAGWSTARSVDEQTQAMVAFNERLWGDDALPEQAALAEKEDMGYAWDEGMVRAADGACDETQYKTQTQCEAHGGTWSGTDAEDSAEAAWAAHLVVPSFHMPMAQFRDPDDPATCIDDVEPPTGDDAEGVRGAVRVLHSQAARGLRGAPIVAYLCTFFPEDTAADVDSICLGPEDDIGLAGWTVDASLCIYGDDANDWWTPVWVAIKVAVTVTFGWLAIALWLPRPALA